MMLLRTTRQEPILRGLAIVSPTPFLVVPTKPTVPPTLVRGHPNDREERKHEKISTDRVRSWSHDWRWLTRSTKKDSVWIKKEAYPKSKNKNPQTQDRQALPPTLSSEKPTYHTSVVSRRGRCCGIAACVLRFGRRASASVRVTVRVRAQL